MTRRTDGATVRPRSYDPARAPAMPMAPAADPNSPELPRVDAETAGRRLDAWLAAQCPALSRSRLKQLILDGRAAVNGRVQREPAAKLRPGDAVTLNVPPPRPAEPPAQGADLDIVFEDEHLIVVDKPAGMVVHPAPGNPDNTLVNALLAHCGDSLRGIGGVARPGIVHRIDKDTSGLLVAAKTEVAHVGLSAQLAAHTMERVYDALVWGIPRPATGRIVGAIGRSAANRKKMAVVKAGGKAAETAYATRRAFGGLAAWVTCRLKTGRTHQIRVHMAARGHPLVGDPVYGGARRLPKNAPAAAAAAVQAFKRQALHARTLGFVHPVTGQRLAFERPPPRDFADLAAALGRVTDGG
ncbi:MAG: RluA family pseudouridine synthase [Rhodospirillaceae bacterium]|nr:RluA family pseudouridine synthase [Rhodospirillaceae bacterium]